MIISRDLPSRLRYESQAAHDKPGLYITHKDTLPTQVKNTHVCKDENMCLVFSFCDKNLRKWLREGKIYFGSEVHSCSCLVKQTSLEEEQGRERLLTTWPSGSRLNERGAGSETEWASPLSHLVNLLVPTSSLAMLSDCDSTCGFRHCGQSPQILIVSPKPVSWQRWL